MTGVSDSLMHGLPPFQSTPTTQNTAHFRAKLSLLIVIVFNTSRVKEVIHIRMHLKNTNKDNGIEIP